MHRAWMVLLTGGLLCLAAGCSTFNHAWRKAEHQPAATHSIEGRWEGRWLSEANGHKGRLRCLISREPDGDYAARFRASYLGVLRFGYTVRLKVETRDGVWHFRGEENLGKLAGGVYEYVGQASATNFHSTYSSRYDHGTFELHRPDEAFGSARQSTAGTCTEQHGDEGSPFDYAKASYDLLVKQMK